MQLLRRIERHILHTNTSASRFGRDAVGDPGFVFGLRNGREPRRRMTERVSRYLDSAEEKTHCR
jgi:hypothetical protein